MIRDFGIPGATVVLLPGGNERTESCEFLGRAKSTRESQA